MKNIEIPCDWINSDSDRLCPNCKSDNISVVFTIPIGDPDSRISPKHICKSCDFTSYVGFQYINKRDRKLNEILSL